MDKYFEINKDGQNIRCKLYFNKNEPIENVVLFGHGFAGHKDNSSAQKFSERVLSKHKGKGVAILVFNLPCHGDDVKKKISLNDCLKYIDIVVDYIKSELQAERIYSYATSFGGYLVLKYIADYSNPFFKIALRCPAINMADVLEKTIMNSDEIEKLNKGKNIKVGFDRKIELNRQFLDELEAADIQQTDYLDFAEDIIIIQGTKDEIVSFETVQQFADNNIIKFVPVENADHRFQNPAYLEIATKSILEFFQLGK